MMASPYLDLIQQDHDLHGWSQPLINHVDCTSNGNEVNISRLSNPSTEPQSPNPSPNPLMVQELGFHGNIQDNNLIYSETLQALYQPKIKEEISQETIQLSELYENNNSIHENYQMIDEKLLLRALQNSTHNIPVPLIQDFLPNNGGDTNYNMVLPSVNILSSFPNPLPLPFPYIVDMDLHAFDLMASGRLNSKPMVREDSRFRLCEMQAVQERPSSNHPKIPSLISGVVEPGGINSGVLENKASHQTISRKSPLETRSPSFSSFKVRKEKLGDRIAALQQLVAPFGKTDTASVLMEAIGYIKFLQDQVETLSVPYLRSSKNKKQRITQVGSKEEKEEPKLDLRSRGLCLVPLSCTSYVTNENGGVWSPPNFHGN